MDKIGIEILRCRRSLAVVAGMKKTNDYAEPTKKLNAKKKRVKVYMIIKTLK